MQETVDAWAREALRRLTALDGVRRAGLALTEGGGRRLLFAASDRDNAGGVAWCHIDAFHEVPLNHAIASGSVVAGSRDELASRYERFTAQQPPAMRALAAVPITAGPTVLGGFVVFLDDDLRLPEQRLVDLGAQLGDRLRVAQATRRRLEPSLATEPLPEGAMVATHVVRHSSRAVAPARAFVRHTLEEWRCDDDCVDTAVLLTSELVTNALVHAASDCEVRVLLDGGLLTTTVRDVGSNRADGHSPTDPLRVHGRGLQLVEAMSSRWGSQLDEVGTTVWFELQVS